MGDQLPAYARRLASLHRAFATDFRNIVNKLAIRPEHTVLDVGCGDGFFTKLLAERGAQVVGVDSDEAFLRHATVAAGNSANIKFVKGDVRRLPQDDASVDVIWSAHSMHSYPDISQCLREFRRILRPGGLLAILESDNIHSVMLSWPPDLELAVRQAEHREIGDEDSYIGTYFPRFAMRMLLEKGFEDFKPEYVLFHRLGPADKSLEEFVTLYLRHLHERTSDHLSEKMQSRLALLADSNSDMFLPRQKTFFLGSMQVLMLARASRLQ